MICTIHICKNMYTVHEGFTSYLSLNVLLFILHRKIVTVCRSLQHKFVTASCDGLRHTKGEIRIL